ncbi:LysR family transcriptional regulator [Vibrio agarivorans]|uniref:LysR family transcriptional regulator n=1 Tax=Vibrio agarivorans TaxID=153622 RepID=UPI00222F5442|nr:LysR family transcriptional regulator [Vibrio agarivorans]MDN3660019.1 LysR family transcriptional regulator [Vibrio agarivorans]
MKLEDIKIFSKVVELGSFTAAAKAFDIPRGKVSRKVNELEQHLNTKLFHRTTRSLSLTNHGETYYKQIIQAIDIIDSAGAQVSRDNPALTGRVKLGLLPSTYTHVQPTLFKFQDAYPEVQLDIRTITNGLEDLINQGLDIAFHSGSLGDTNLVAKHLLAIERCLVASPEYLARYGSPQDSSELVEHDAVCFRHPSGHVEEEWPMNGIVVPVSPRLVCDSVGFIMSATMEGRGISYLPRVMILEELANGSLVDFLPSEDVYREDGWLLYPPRQTLNQASRTLIDWIVNDSIRLAGEE